MKQEPLVSPFIRLKNNSLLRACQWLGDPGDGSDETGEEGSCMSELDFCNSGYVADKFFFLIVPRLLIRRS